MRLQTSQSSLSGEWHGSGSLEISAYRACNAVGFSQVFEKAEELPPQGIQDRKLRAPCRQRLLSGLRPARLRDRFAAERRRLDRNTIQDDESYETTTRPRKRGSSTMANGQRTYWVVSPNVKNDNRTAGEWRRASVTTRAAFMGWHPDDPEHGQMGPKFAGKVPGGIEPGDVILIAQRYAGAPEIVGFGVVDGDAKTELPGFDPPDEDFGSLRTLRPFVPWSRPPADIPFAAAVTHTRALARLHPGSHDAHRRICEWMERHLEHFAAPGRFSTELPTTNASEGLPTHDDDPEPRDISIVSSPGNCQLDYEVRSKAEVRRAQRQEARLLENYRKWLHNQDRKLDAIRYGGLPCDGYEKSTRNLIEAKSSASREHIRMAVGQLLDYAFQGKTKLGEPRMAVLLPERPTKDIEAWLNSVGIGVIWSQGDVFLDNANGQFT